MTGIAALAGYLLGGLPTADWVAAAFGVELRSDGSGNPGANNARRLGGIRVGISVLMAESFKGAAVVMFAGAVGDQWTMAAAGIGAVAGNVYNPYRRLKGGQGLGITAGILCATWPWFLPVVVAVIGIAALTTHSAPKAAMAAVAAFPLGALVWTIGELPVAWGLGGAPLAVLAAGVVIAIAPKQIRNLGTDRRSHHDPTVV